MSEFKAVESTGKPMREFGTGSVRDNAEGKGRWDLIPYSGLLRLAVHYENGAKKYGDRNWEKGQPVHEYLNSAMRHLARFIAGENGEDHLSAVAWNVFGAIHTMDQVAKGNLPYELVENLHPDHLKRIKEDVHAGWKESGKAFLAKQQGEGELEKMMATYLTKVDAQQLAKYIENGYSIKFCMEHDLALEVTLDKEETE